jgi:hypothetical protein
MGASNPTQYTFQQGEVSPWAQGRIDLPTYRQSMNLCLNSFPTEEGAWTRRPGFFDVGYTYKGYAGIIRSFIAGDIATSGVNTVYGLEITSDGANSWLRVWEPTANGYPGLLCDAAVGTITSFSGATPTLMTMGSAQNWATGDTIIITNNTGTGASAATVRNRQLIVTKVSTTTFTLADAVTGASIVGSGMSYTTTTASAQRIVVKTLPYTSVAEVSKVRVVQSGIAALLLSKGHAPWLLEIDGGAITVSKDADF